MDNIYYIQSLFSAMPFSVSSEDDLDKLPACNLITQTTLVCAIYILQTSKVDCKAHADWNAEGPMGCESCAT